MFPEADHKTMVMLYKAYSLGFKEGYSLSHPDATIDIGNSKTLGEILYAAQQERSKDSSGNGEVLR